MFRIMNFIHFVFDKLYSARREVKFRELLRCPCGKRAHLEHVSKIRGDGFLVCALCKCGRSTDIYYANDDTMELIENTVVTEWNEMNSNQ